MQKFEPRQELYVISEGAWNGTRVVVKSRLNNYDPTLYTVRTLDMKHDLAFYQTELETVFEHDGRLGLIGGSKMNHNNTCGKTKELHNENQLAIDRRHWLDAYCTEKSLITKELTNLSLFWSKDYYAINKVWDDRIIYDIGRNIYEVFVNHCTTDYNTCPFCYKSAFDIGYKHKPSAATVDCKNCEYGIAHGVCTQSKVGGGTTTGVTYSSIIKRLGTGCLVHGKVLNKLNQFISTHPYPGISIKKSCLVDRIKIGDPILSIVDGWGTVTSVNNEHTNRGYPICVKYDLGTDDEIKTREKTYSKEGYHYLLEKHPTIFRNKSEMLSSLQSLPEDPPVRLIEVETYRWLFKSEGNRFCITKRSHENVDDIYGSEPNAKDIKTVLYKIDESLVKIKRPAKRGEEHV